jgi:ribose 5-phosphate isomerase A
MVVLASEYLGRRIKDGSLAGVTALPTSAASAAEAAFYGVPVAPPPAGTTPRVDVMIEQAEEISEQDGTLPFVTGRSRSPAQPELRRAQELRETASTLVVLATEDAVAPALDGCVPILVDAEEWEEVAESLDDIFLGDAALWRRPMSGIADPFGGDRPYVSAEGHTIVDLVFEDGLRIAGERASAAEICAAIEGVAGVLAHGLEAEGRGRRRRNGTTVLGRNGTEQ